MPNFYHKVVNSLRRQFGLLVVARLVLRNFGYQTYCSGNVFPLLAVGDTNLQSFPICIFSTALVYIMEKGK